MTTGNLAFFVTRLTAPRGQANATPIAIPITQAAANAQPNLADHSATNARTSTRMKLAATSQVNATSTIAAPASRPVDTRRFIAPLPPSDPPQPASSAMPSGPGRSDVSVVALDRSGVTSEWQGAPIVSVAVTVSDTGSVTGREVIQAYVADLTATAPRPSHELKAFDKVLLAPGASHRVDFVLTERDVSYWSSHASTTSCSRSFATARAVTSRSSSNLS
ncbi:MAG: fibronectin type III-like domain-contianing protein [Ilumatobacteraceae bacterium]